MIRDRDLCARGYAIWSKHGHSKAALRHLKSTPKSCLVKAFAFSSSDPETERPRVVPGSTDRDAVDIAFSLFINSEKAKENSN